MNHGLNQIKTKGRHGATKVKQTLHRLLPKPSDKPLKPWTIYLGIAIVLVALFLITLPTILDDSKLEKLGYSELAINGIHEAELVDEVIELNRYNATINTVFENQLNVDPTYLPLYLVNSTVDDTLILKYQRLVVKGYSESEILTLLTTLKDYELTVLLTLPKIDDIQMYIDDCANHPDNSYESFTLDNQYYEPYNMDQSQQSDASNVNMLVNKLNYLGSDYSPVGLGEVSVRYAASGIQLAEECSAALSRMSEAYTSLGYPTGFFVSSGYRDYASQQSAYDGYVASVGADEANNYAIQPGFSEHQTGLAMDLASTAPDLTFEETTEFAWVSINCQDYGFILRYPQGKEYITGINYEPWHYRYVGVETAQAVVNSGMTYEEYYELYLRPLPENIDQLVMENQKAKEEEVVETIAPVETESLIPTIPADPRASATASSEPQTSEESE